MKNWFYSFKIVRQILGGHWKYVRDRKYVVGNYIYYWTREVPNTPYASVLKGEIYSD